MSIKAIHLGVVMDAPESIHLEKDSTLAILKEAVKRGWIIHYFEQKNLYTRDGIAYGDSRLLHFSDNNTPLFYLSSEKNLALSELDVILMRKDPPFNLNYIYTTYILELAEKAGVKVFNKPQSLRDVNEKFFIHYFPEYCVPTRVTSDIKKLRDFFQEQQDIICKPLDGMGGASIFRVKQGDGNASVIFETLTQHGTHYIMAQRFIPEIALGDKRVLLINGKPVPYALARIPAAGELRGNLAAGGHGIAQPLTKRESEISEAVGVVMREKGLLLVGLDIIGDYLTEINVTSPTCIRELEKQCGLNISGEVVDAILKFMSKDF